MIGVIGDWQSAVKRESFHFPHLPRSHLCWPGPQFNIKMSSYHYRKSHCGDKTAVRSSYLQRGISYNDKMTSLHWIGPLVAKREPELMRMKCESVDFTMIRRVEGCHLTVITISVDDWSVGLSRFDNRHVSTSWFADDILLSHFSVVDCLYLGKINVRRPSGIWLRSYSKHNEWFVTRKYIHVYVYLSFGDRRFHRRSFVTAITATNAVSWRALDCCTVLAWCQQDCQWGMGHGLHLARTGGNFLETGFEKYVADL